MRFMCSCTVPYTFPRNSRYGTRTLFFGSYTFRIIIRRATLLLVLLRYISLIWLYYKGLSNYRVYEFQVVGFNTIVSRDQTSFGLHQNVKRKENVELWTFNCPLIFQSISNRKKITDTCTILSPLPNCIVHFMFYVDVHAFRIHDLVKNANDIESSKSKYE